MGMGDVYGQHGPIARSRRVCVDLHVPVHDRALPVRSSGESQRSRQFGAVLPLARLHLDERLQGLATDSTHVVGNRSFLCFQA